MKNIKINGEVITVTKKDIRQFLTLERGVSYYSGLSTNTLAHAVGMAAVILGWDGSETLAMKVDECYNKADELMQEYVAYDNLLRNEA